jgi:hypothetical protein
MLEDHFSKTLRDFRYDRGELKVKAQKVKQVKVD